MSLLVHQLIDRLEQCDPQQVVYLNIEEPSNNPNELDTLHTIDCIGTVGGNDSPLALLGLLD